MDNAVPHQSTIKLMTMLLLLLTGNSSTLALRSLAPANS